MFAATLAIAPVLRLPALVSDHMVMQRDTNVRVWGWAEPGQEVSISPSWAKPVEVKAARSGKWEVWIKTGTDKKTHTVTVKSGTESVAVKDVLFGEVWVCSGQSNMEWPLGPHQGMTQVTNAKTEVERADYPQIRLFHVPRLPAAKPVEDVDAQWKPCTPANIHNFSAVAYFFGRELHWRLDVPIGLVMTAVGGTEAELWTSREALMHLPDFARAIRAAEDPTRRTAVLDKWHSDNSAADPGWPEWTEHGPEGLTATMPFSTKWSTTTYSEFDGSLWVSRWFDAEGLDPDRESTLSLGTIDDADTTWVNGKLVGETLGWGIERNYTIPKGTLKPQGNSVVVRVLDTGGEGGASGSATLKQGRFSLDISDHWSVRKGADLKDLPRLPNVNGPAYSTLYNGMLAPLTNYTVRGAIWYQGESNVGRAWQYRTLFPAMIRDWRSAWGQESLPFYFVQIAPFNYGSGLSAELREAQSEALRLPDTGVVVTTDLVPNPGDIHPPMKQQVGLRLALHALSGPYGKLVGDPSGPTLRRAAREGAAMRLWLDRAEGLTGSLKGFEVAGKDQVWHPATATIEGKSVKVWSDKCHEPVAVRQGWSDVPEPALRNSAGIPMSPFSTDTWPRKTAGVRWGH